MSVNSLSTNFINAWDGVRPSFTLSPIAFSCTLSRKNLITSRATSASNSERLTSRIASLMLSSESLFFPCKALKLLDSLSVKLSNITFKQSELSYYIIFCIDKARNGHTIHPPLCCLLDCWTITD